MAVLILIAGGSSSGKTTIAQEVLSKIGRTRTCMISTDNYYRDLRHLPEEQIARTNFDHPDSIDHARMAADVRTLLEGSEACIPIYDFVTHRRDDDRTIPIGPVDVVVLEGIFALFDTDLARLAHLKIFVETDADVRLVRRLRRDIIERGFTVEGVLDQYEKTVKPMHEAFIEPTKKRADIIVPGDRPFVTALRILEGFVVNELIDQIQGELRSTPSGDGPR